MALDNIRAKFNAQLEELEDLLSASETCFLSPNPPIHSLNHG